VARGIKSIETEHDDHSRRTKKKDFQIPGSSKIKTKKAEIPTELISDDLQIHFFVDAPDFEYVSCCCAHRLFIDR
jgi:hypothetical protein